MAIWMMIILLQLVLVLVAAAAASPSPFSVGTVMCRPEERDALLSFKAAFPVSNYLSPWERDGNCCKWDGVTCDSRTGHVVKLDLSSSELNGSFPANTTLVFLPQLHHLILSGNYLSGQVPLEIGNKAWSDHFATTLWWTWKWRNKRVFEGVSWQGNKAEFVRTYMVEFEAAQRRIVDRPLMRNKSVQQIGWRKPPHGWIKCNSDGARTDALGSASGGILRSESGAWIKGYTRRLGSSSILRAELWDIFDGLSFAWNLGFRHVIYESDSLMVVQLIRYSSIKNFHSLASLVHKCRGLLRRSWTVCFGHVFHEANKAADCMAGLALCSGFVCLVVESPPSEILPILRIDALGATSPRMVLS